MKNFTFHNPTKIIFGKGCIVKLKDQIPADAKVLIIYGGGSAERTGVLDQVRTALTGRELVEFGGIEPNPRFATAMKAVELIKQHKSTFLLAVGGGSVIDATKFIAAAALYEGDAWEILTSRGAVRSEEHTSELQSRPHLVCRLLLEKKKKKKTQKLPSTKKK